MADGLREGLKNPPKTDEEREELYNRLFVEGHRFPTFEEVEAELWRGVKGERR